MVVENEEREMVSFLQIINLKMRKKMNTDVWEHKSKFYSMSINQFWEYEIIKV